MLSLPRATRERNSISLYRLLKCKRNVNVKPEKSSRTTVCEGRTFPTIPNIRLKLREMRGSYTSTLFTKSHLGKSYLPNPALLTCGK